MTTPHKTAQTLARRLGVMFRPTAARKPDTHRKARETARVLAAQHGIEIERLRGGGFNVWPPHASATGRIHPGVETVDEFDGDHYCNEWDEVLHMVKAYAKHTPTGWEPGK